MDFGQNIVVRYGADETNSHVDLMGPAMNIAAKIQNMAKPNQILIGSDVCKRLHPSSQTHFQEIVWKKVAESEPQIVWLYTRNNTLKKECFDQADAYTCVQGYMKQQGLW